MAVQFFGVDIRIGKIGRNMLLRLFWEQPKTFIAFDAIL